MVMFPPSSSSSPSQIVLHDLWKALQDEDIRGDLQLVGRDGIRVPANRFVLGARSEMFKRMLYGDFREALQTEIHLEQYEGLILQAVVEFCHSNEISQFTVLYLSQQTELAGRRLVQLYKAADYLQIGGLTELVEGLVHNRTTRFPPLACAIYDEADLDTPLSKDALLMIRCRPYVTLPPSGSSFGGILCLEGAKLQTLYVDQNLKAGELFLFEMLQSWSTLKRQQQEEEEKGKSDNNTDKKEEDGDDEITSIVQECASHLHLEDIEPQDLLSIVQPSGFCSTEAITKAITCQALRASAHHIWSLSSRGRPNNVERILVEGAGSLDANGIYYYIEGLANGDLYTKREIACGQQYVYTLSISEQQQEEGNNDTNATTECRIFCSKLLTHNGCQIIATNKYLRQNNNRLFQPLLQIIDIITDDDSDYTLLQLSDGDHCLHGKIRKSERSHNLKTNTLIKVLRFAKYTPDNSNNSNNDDNQVAIRLKKISVVSLDPGHKFGNPVYYFDVFDAIEFVDDQDAVVMADTNSPIEVEVSQEIHSELSQQGSVNNNEGNSGKNDNGGTLLEMYSCRFTSDQKPIHSKIPSTGWKMDRHGCEPVPRARWIPAKPAEGKITTSLDTTSPSLRNNSTNNNTSARGRRGV